MHGACGSCMRGARRSSPLSTLQRLLGTMREGACPLHPFVRPPLESSVLRCPAHIVQRLLEMMQEGGCPRPNEVLAAAKRLFQDGESVATTETGLGCWVWTSSVECVSIPCDSIHPCRLR